MTLQAESVSVAFYDLLRYVEVVRSLEKKSICSIQIGSSRLIVDNNPKLLSYERG
jgi:hypothetical protein